MMETHNTMTPIPKKYTNCHPCFPGQWGHPTPSLLKNPTLMNYALQEMFWKVTNKSILDSPLYKRKGPATCENRSSFILIKLSAGQHPGARFWLIFCVNFRNFICLLSFLILLKQHILMPIIVKKYVDVFNQNFQQVNTCVRKMIALPVMESRMAQKYTRQLKHKTRILINSRVLKN